MFVISADDEMRAIVRETIRGQIVTLVKADVIKEVEEGIRRAKGSGNQTLEQTIMRTIERVATERIESAMKNVRLTEIAKEVINRRVEAAISARLDALVKEQKIDIQALAKKAISERMSVIFK